MMQHLPPFWRTLVRHPRQVGAIAPAGRNLGRAISRALLAEGPPGVVIELGAGTGAITQALLRVRDQLHYLAAIEKSPELASSLLQRFPELTVLTLCASKIEHVRLPPHERLTVVSSLPFASLPKDESLRVCDSLNRISSRYRDFRLIQYSYFGRTPFTSPSDELVWTRGPTVLWNLPPATIWTLAKRTDRKPILRPHSRAPHAPAR